MPGLVVPLTYRAEIVRPLLRALMAGDSCTLIGVGSSGKSRLMKHIHRPEVRQHWLGPEASRTLSVLVDCNAITEYSVPSLQRRMLTSLLDSIRLRGIDWSGAETEVRDLLSRPAATAADAMYDNLSAGVRAAVAAGASHLFFLMDGFDRVVERLPFPELGGLNSLRALRDIHKSQLTGFSPVTYVLATRRELAFLRTEDNADGEYQDFHELVSRRLMPIGPYADRDADFMVQDLAARYGMEDWLGESGRQRIKELSGRHAGLIDAILRVIRDEALAGRPDSEWRSRLMGHRDIDPECEKIVESLEGDEVSELQRLAARHTVAHDDVARRLGRKGLIQQATGDSAAIFSPLFADYVSRLAPAPPPAAEPGATVWEIVVRGQRIGGLDEVEYRLYERLLQAQPQAVGRAELWAVMAAARPGAAGYRFRGPPEQRFTRYMAELQSRINTVAPGMLSDEPGGFYRLVL